VAPRSSIYIIEEEDNHIGDEVLSPNGSLEEDPPFDAKIISQEVDLR
jgi:hypothetical protein